MQLAITTTISVAFLAISLAVASVQLTLQPPPPATQRQRAADINLMKFMIKTQDIAKQDPRNSYECFNYYVPVLNNITMEYEREYYECLIRADQAKDLVNNQTAAYLVPIHNAASHSCQFLAYCGSLEATLNALRCFEQVGSDATKTMYEISANATELAGSLEEEYHSIDNHLYRCTNATERAYIENTAKTYEELQRCIAGEIQVPQNPVAP